jgi:hypothetical protein
MNLGPIVAHKILLKPLCLSNPEPDKNHSPDIGVSGAKNNQRFIINKLPQLIGSAQIQMPGRQIQKHLQGRD